MPLKDQLNQWKTKLETINREHNLLPFGQGKPQYSQQQYSVPPSSQQYHQQPYTNPPHHPPWPGQQPGYGPPPPSQPQYYNRPPPPIPQHSHPGYQQAMPLQQAVTQRYWTARFDPSIDVGAEWEHKEGNNNGWGNAELENYTKSPENSFYTVDNKLIIRAITYRGNHTSARLVSRQTLARSRGCLTSILTLPVAVGIWPAFWLLPREPFTWPHEGEIDIAEAWNAESTNHTCLHWGFYTPEDNWKHLVKQTHIPDMQQRPIRFDFVWHDSGRLVWYVDDRPVMKATMPSGARNIADFCVIMNVAMGGNVCGGKAPHDGAYDMVVHSVYMSDAPELGGWNRFEADWQTCPEGNRM